MNVFLLVWASIATVALFVLFHHHMVNLRDWHLFLSSRAVAVEKDLAALRQWITEHFHLHTAPTANSPAAPDAAAKT